MLGSVEDRYLRQLSGRLRDTLGPALVAAYLTGSGALGGYEPGPSDLDVLVIAGEPLEDGTKARLAASLAHRALPCPARCLELVVYAAGSVTRPGAAVPYELNFDTGAGMEDHVSFDPGAEPAHWFLLDVAITRAHGRPLLGPPAAEVIGEVPRRHALAALGASLRWHEEHEGASANAVLNACRAWHYADTGVWSPKRAAARWAVDHGADGALVAEALARRDDGGRLDPEAVRAFIGRISDLVDPPS